MRPSVLPEADSSCIGRFCLARSDRFSEETDSILDTFYPQIARFVFAKRGRYKKYCYPLPQVFFFQQSYSCCVAPTGTNIPLSVTFGGNFYGQFEGYFLGTFEGRLEGKLGVHSYGNFRATLSVTFRRTSGISLKVPLTASLGETFRVPFTATSRVTCEAP